MYIYIYISTYIYIYRYILNVNHSAFVEGVLFTNFPKVHPDWILFIVKPLKCNISIVYSECLSSDVVFSEAMVLYVFSRTGPTGSADFN